MFYLFIGKSHYHSTTMFFQPLDTWDTLTSEQPRSGSFKLDRTAAISWWRLLLAGAASPAGGDAAAAVTGLLAPRAARTLPSTHTPLQYTHRDI